MSHRLAQSARVLFIFAAIPLLAAIRPEPALAPTIGSAATYTGTVKAIQPDKSMDLLIGVGYAVRILHIGVQPATQLLRGTAAIRLGDITPGDIVRTECHMTDQGLMADRIEKLAPEATP